MEKPQIFNAQENSLEDIKKSLQIDQLVDPIDDLLDELYLIRNPHLKFVSDYSEGYKAFIDEYSSGEPLEKVGNWIYLPWYKMLVHYLDDSEHQEIRTARNKNLITQSEQDTFYNFTVAVAGLSVGSHGAITTSLMGGARHIKLADPDVLSGTNLNRNRFDFAKIGVNKCELVARYIYQLNPYAEIEIFSEGLNSKNMDSFLSGSDILVEELDDIQVKVDIRKKAKELKLPVIMATDNADSVIMDIERFDLDPDYPIFHGNLDGFDLTEINSSPEKLYEAMARIIDIRMVPVRVQQSVKEVGKTLYSWPQLASAATLSGSVIAYTIRKIANKEPLKSGKIQVNLEEIFNPEYDAVLKEQHASAEEFMRMFKNKHGE